MFSATGNLPAGRFGCHSKFGSRTNGVCLNDVGKFMTFSPQAFTRGERIPTMTVASFLLFGGRIPIKRASSPLGDDVAFSSGIMLATSRGSFSFHVTTLDCRTPEVGGLVCGLRNFSRN